MVYDTNIVESTYYTDIIGLVPRLASLELDLLSNLAYIQNV